MLLILDNGISKDDKLSYTKNLIASLNNLKIDYIIVNKIQDIDHVKNKIKGIIITGSSMKLSKLSKKGSFEKYSFNIYYMNKFDVPVYGLCFGCQLLNIIYGGKLKDNIKYVCKDIDFQDYDNKCPLLKNIKIINFGYCFSDIVIPNKNLNIHVFASIIINNNKKIGCGFEFEKNKIYGSLFHQELYNHTQVLFKNFYDICKKYQKSK